MEWTAPIAVMVVMAAWTCFLQYGNAKAFGRIVAELKDVCQRLFLLDERDAEERRKRR